jgi:dihydrofolate synthase/folylpolyglutamate synthase
MMASSSVPMRVMPDQYDPDPRLQSILDRLTTYYPRAIDPDLGRTIRLLRDLGNPHLKMPPAIHVAGTNGKGSTVAFLRAMVEASGKICHVMTSPHLVHFNERIVLGGQVISNQNLIELLEEVEATNNGQETTSFELITAAGFLAFSRQPADVSIVEVGMGGRLDATNVISQPLVSIITVISRDHVKFLGDTLDKIAAEKAGIIKQACPCVIGPQTREGLAGGVMQVFEDKAALENAPLYRHGIDWSYDVLGDRFILHTPTNIYELPKPNLKGHHQFDNAATAVMGLLAISEQFSIPMEALDKGLTSATWAGRLQQIKAGPLLNHMPDTIELWIDGGHNDTGGMILGEQAKEWLREDGKPLHVIMGMLNTKNPTEFANFLLPHAASAQAVTIPEQPLSLSAHELSACLGIPSAASLESAIQAIITKNERQQKIRILVTGSLYLMGYILRDHA